MFLHVTLYVRWGGRKARRIFNSQNTLTSREGKGKKALEQKIVWSAPDVLYFHLTVQWGKIYLISFNNFKTKLVTFDHHRAEFVFSPEKGCTLKEASCFEHQLRNKFISDVKWESRVRSVDWENDAGETIDFLYRSRNYLSHSANLYLYKLQIKAKIAYWRHIWTGAANTLFPASMKFKSVYATL